MRPAADIIDPPFRSGTYSSRTIVIAFRETELVETHLVVAQILFTV
jgi:hypothetical protein